MLLIGKNNPAVWCTKHAKQFSTTMIEIDSDHTQQLVKQYWKAECGCEVEVTLALPLDSQMSAEVH